MTTKNVNILKPGFQLHWYRIESVLGQGGFGITYLAVDQNLQEKVAIKEYYPPQFATRTEEGSVQQISEEHTDNYTWGLDRFISEARTLTRYREPSIVRVRNVFEANNTAYMVMDFLEGETLAEKLKGRKTLPEDILMAMILPLLEGLEVVHASGFIHRDIKPANIIIRDHQAVLIDFGAARQAIGERSVSITQIASAGYAPFEQYHSKDDQQGPWSDIYALGATLYKAMTGIAPSTAIDRSKSLLEASRDTYVSVRELCQEGYSDSLINAVDHALAFRASDRPQTVAVWREELAGGEIPEVDSEVLTEISEEPGPWGREECKQIKQQLQQVLGSSAFITAGQLQKLLSFLVEETLAGRGERITQAGIAIDVLGKDASFDATVDASVRVEVRRLRSRLMEYYYGEGKDDAIRFELPKGQYGISIALEHAAEEPGLVESIKSVSYRVRGASRSRLRHLTASRIQVSAFVIVFFAAVLVVLVDRRYFTEDVTTPASVTVQAPAPETEPAKPTVMPDSKSIAVLPFANNSAMAEEAAFFAAGLHDDVLSQFTRIKDMKVISRTSVMRYQETTMSIPEIARELNVAIVMEGSVQRSGDRLRINVQLIDAQTDEHLWAETYNKELTTANIFDVQRDIAVQAAGFLEATITPEEEQRIARLPTENLEAYEAYMIGKQRIIGRHPDDITAAQEYFQKSVDLDPDFALAWVNLASTYTLQIEYSLMSAEEMLPRAESALERAFGLDANLGEAYALLGVHRHMKKDFPGAEEAYKKAISLSPNYGDVYAWYSLLLRAEFLRFKDALSLLLNAQELDPMSIMLKNNLVMSYMSVGEFDEAMALTDKMIEIDPDHAFAYYHKMRLYWLVYGQLDKAFLLGKKIQKLYPGSSNTTPAWLALDLGDDRMAECFAREALKIEPNRIQAFWVLSYIYLYRGDEAQAYSYVDKAMTVDPNAWHVSRYLDLKNGEYQKRRSIYEKSNPKLLAEDNPEIDIHTYSEAIKLANILQHTGNQKRAVMLLERSLAFLENADLPRGGDYGYGIADVYIYALQGKKEKALATLQQAVDEGWRTEWINLVYEPNLDSIRNEPKFQAVLQNDRAKMEKQLARVRAMEKEGDICVFKDSNSEKIQPAPNSQQEQRNLLTAVPEQKSVAVLPFTNRSKNEDDAYFADGLHDDLLTHLARITDMKVISRTSVMGYRDTIKNLKTIGTELGVATLLEGSVQRAGDQVRINVQLIDAATDAHIWAETYDRELTAVNIFTMQTEIATAIARALKATVTPGEKQRLATIPTENMAALEAYFRGKQQMALRSDATLKAAVRNFQEAIDIDPGFALAYAELAVTYLLQIQLSGLPKEEMFGKAERMINKALELDPLSGEAYAALGLLRSYQDQGLNNAETAFVTALKLNPNYAMAYNWYGNVLLAQGKIKEADRIRSKALELDPRSPTLLINYATRLVNQERFDEVLEQLDRVISIVPDSSMGYWQKGDYYYTVAGRLDEAAVWYRKAHSVDAGNVIIPAILTYVFMDLGDDREAECWLNRSRTLSPHNAMIDLALGFFHLQQGNEQQAIFHARKVHEGKGTPRLTQGALAIQRYIELRRGDYTAVRSLYEKHYPELITDGNPQLNDQNFRAAIDFAFVLQKTGELELADELLNGSLKYTENKTRFGVHGSWINDVLIYAHQGKTRQALQSLREAIDEGWRLSWRTFLETDLYLASLRSEPEFQAMVAEIESDIARQLKSLRAKEQPGEACVDA